jgi:hypothetical protein
MFGTCLDVPIFVVAADTLYKDVKFDKYPIAIVQNTSSINDEGEHWIAWYVLSETEVEYFDSYGSHVDTYVNIDKPKMEIVRENCKCLQSLYSYVCGNYCIY